jgi:predicted DCC family thiol-disulfide oxidoreductase YuxK
MLHVIYDDECGFCIRSLKVLRALDIGGQLRFYGASHFRRQPDPHGTPEGRERFPELANADLDSAMFAVGPDRMVARGFFAVRRIAREVPLLWPLLPLLYLPGSRILGPRVYAWVARNRGRFGCESEVCDLEPGRPPA